MFANKHYILAIWEEGGFSKAAERLYISQPSLSASVKRIEEKISVPIFNRSTVPVSLTEVGEQYVKYALEIEEKEKDFERYIADYTNLLTGSVRIGGSSFFSSFMIPFMISEFNKKYPNVNFEIFEDNTKDLIEKLSLGNLDIIIDNSVINDDNTSSVVCTSEMLLLAVPLDWSVNKKLKDYRLTAKDIKRGRHLNEKLSVSLKEFSEHDFILLKPENDTGRRAKELFEKYNINPSVPLFLDQQVTAYNISVTGRGISFVSDTLVKYMESETGLYYYRLADQEMTRNIYFCTKNNHYMSYACQKFIEFNTISS